jgi:hypothetical protein
MHLLAERLIFSGVVIEFHEKESQDLSNVAS